MGGKVDRKALMRKSLATEASDADKRLKIVDERFAAAAAVDAAKPDSTFRAESSGHRRIRVKIALVDDNAFNPRQIYDPEVVKERAASIAANGQQEAAKAAIHPDNPERYMLIDGGYRKRALLHLGEDEIDLELREVASKLDFYKLGRLFNKERDDQSALDDALSWKVMLDNKLVENEEGLVDVVGMSWPMINKCMALTKLPDVAIAKIREHHRKIGVAIGYELYQFSTFSPEDELLALIDRIVTEDLSSREVERLRKAAQNPRPARQPKRMSRQYKINTDGKTGVIKDWDHGRVTFEVKGLNPADRVSLVEDLRKRFGVDLEPSA